MKPTWQYYLHSAVLSCFAIARPLFAKFEAQPDFLVAHGLMGSQLFLFAAAITIIPIIAVWALLFLARIGGPASQRIVFLAIALIMGTLIVLPIADVFVSHYILTILLSLAAGALLAYSCSRIRATELFLSYLSPAILIVPAFFLFASPAAKLHGAGQKAQTGLQVVGARFPIVMVVFDEFSIVSLLDENSDIDGDRFPNFQALAETSSWYPNATTVAETTTKAIPAMLTGFEARPAVPAVQKEYPGNLFDRLAGSYQVFAYESGTALCQSPCASLTGEKKTLLSGRKELFSDVSIVWLHVVTPAALRPRLPDISTDWHGFGGKSTNDSPDSPGSGDWRSRSGAARQFILRLEELDNHSAFYLHSLLPHYGWEFLPDGRRYSLQESGGVFGVITEAAGSKPPNSWIDDDWLPLQAYRRHLLQTGFVDSIVGEILKALHDSGNFEDTLLIITADHGAAFDRRSSRRGIGPLNIAEIANIPLFIKFPGQSDANVDKRAVNLLDIYPTIMELLKGGSNDEAPGFSLLGDIPEKRDLVVLKNNGVPFRFTRDELIRSRSQALKRIIPSTGTGSFKNVYRSGIHTNLHGLSPDNLGYSLSEREVTLDEHWRLANVTTGESFIYTNIRGRISSLDRQVPPQDLALAVNGSICSTTRSYPSPGGEHEFRALINPDCLIAGENEVAVFFVTSDQLERLQLSSVERYSLDLENRLITGSEGTTRYPIVDNASLGWFSCSDVTEGQAVTIGGWAANMARQSPAEKVIIFMDGVSYMSLAPRLPRPHEANVYSAPGMLNSGFETIISHSATSADHEVRAFGIFDGKATELYPSFSEARPWPFRKVQPVLPARTDW